MGTFDVAISYKLSNKSNMTWVFQGEQIDASSDEHAVAEATMALVKSLHAGALKDVVIISAEITNREPF